MAPSAKHIELQNMAIRWIGNRSFKMCALLECIAVGYNADVVAIAGMHDHHHERYANHSGLEKKYMRSVLKEDYMDRTGNDRWIREIHGDIDRWYVNVFEVKVSRSDFLNTFGPGKDSGHAKARMKPVGTAHWVVADKGVCSPSELPDFWGLLEPYGTGLTEKKIPKLNVLSESTLHSIAFDMLWLQMNGRASQYNQLRDMADAIKDVRQAAIRGKPMAEIVRLTWIAVEECRGFTD